MRSCLDGFGEIGHETDLQDQGFAIIKLINVHTKVGKEWMRDVKYRVTVLNTVSTNKELKKVCIQE